MTSVNGLKGGVYSWCEQCHVTMSLERSLAEIVVSITGVNSGVNQILILSVLLTCIDTLPFLTHN